jgi:hypothetical protein
MAHVSDVLSFCSCCLLVVPLCMFMVVSFSYAECIIAFLIPMG